MDLTHLPPSYRVALLHLKSTNAIRRIKVLDETVSLFDRYLCKLTIFVKDME